MESTTSSATNTQTPVRRISRKAHHKSESEITETQCEKGTPYSPITDSPFHNSSNPPPQPSDLPILTTKSIKAESSDIEAQDKYHFKKSIWRQRIVAYLVLGIAVFVWLMLIVGVLVLTDNFLPGALRSYHILKNMGAELANAKFEVAGLQAQVGTLWQFVNQMRSFQKEGE